MPAARQKVAVCSSSAQGEIAANHPGHVGQQTDGGEKSRMAAARRILKKLEKFLLCFGSPDKNQVIIAVQGKKGIRTHNQVSR